MTVRRAIASWSHRFVLGGGQATRAALGCLFFAGGFAATCPGIAHAASIRYATQETVKGLPALNDPADVVVSPSGDLYVLDRGTDQVLEETLGKKPKAKALPFSGLDYPSGLAVNSVGDVFVADTYNDRVVELPAGSSTQTVLPFSGLSNPAGVAVDAHGDVFVSDTGNDRILELKQGSSSPTVLPFSGLSTPRGLALNANGGLFVADWGNARVVELPAGATGQTVLSFSGLDNPCRVWVDSVGDVFVSDCSASTVSEIPIGATKSEVLPFNFSGSGNGGVEGVAVDAGGDVFADDDNNNRIVAYQLVAPAAPDVSATAKSGAVTLTWLAAPYQSLSGYNVYEGTMPGKESSTPVNKTPVAGAATKYVVSGLTNGVTYYFTVRAINPIGASAPSTEVSAAPDK